MSYLSRAHRAQAESQGAAQTPNPAKVAEAVATQTIDHAALAEQVAAKWAPRPQGEADPLAASDQAGTAGAGKGWTAIIAARPEVPGMVASGGPASPHPSALTENL